MNLNFLTYYLNSSVSVSRSLVFRTVGKFHQWSLYLRILKVSSTAKSYCPVNLFYVVSKVIEKLVNNRIVDHLDEQGLFLISSMADFILIVVSDRIAKAFNRSGAGADLIYPRLLEGFVMLVFFANLVLWNLSAHSL